MTNDYSIIVERFKGLQRASSKGVPFWMARDIMGALAYKEWRSFHEVIERAKTSCEMAGNFSANHFVLSPEMVEIGSGAKKERENFVLSKYACYLVAMNGDPSKPEIAAAQAYFVEQTYLQEQQAALTEEERRALLRDRVKDANKKLGGAAKQAGVRSAMFGVFNDEGYKGLYGGLGYQYIKKIKGIGPKDDLLDCIGRTELAANEFRITQTEEKLRLENITGEQKAIETHRKVGTEVRKTISTIGGTMPEKLPAAPSIKRIKSAEKRSLNDGK